VTRRAYLWLVRPGSAAEYKDLHRAIPASLEAEIKERGIRDYSIFYCKETEQLFAVQERGVEQDPAPPKSDVGEAWAERMRGLLVLDVDGSVLQFELEEVFRLD